MKILFLGSSHFSKIVLEKMLEKDLNVCAIITQPDKPSGRGHKLLPTEVKSYGQEKNIPVFTFDRIKLHLDEIKNIDYDLAVVASFGQILPKDFLDYKLTINVHPSLLPKYRGPSPIQSALLNGDKITGVTIMKVACEVDAGDIILQKEFAINDEYYGDLEEKLALLGGEMVKESVCAIENGTVKFTPQDSSFATFTTKFTKEDGRLDFTKSAPEIVNRVRALSEEVGCYITLSDQFIKVGKAIDVTGKFETKMSTILNYKKNFIIGCKDSAVEILYAQAPSGKMILGRDFINGHNDVLGKNVL